MLKFLFAFLFSLLFGSTVAVCQEVVNQASQAGLGAILMPFLPPVAADTIAIVFATVGAANAVSIVLEKIAAKTVTTKDDAAIAKLQKGIVTVQKVLNFFIGKR